MHARRYLTPHIGGTAVWNMWLRLLGARIGRGCVVDTNNINEPDLISIGHNVLVAEDAFVSAATIVPPGFVDEHGARCCAPLEHALQRAYLGSSLRIASPRSVRLTLSDHAWLHSLLAAGCLILSTSVVGDNSVLGRRSVVPAGSRLARDKLLRPYAAPNHLRGVLDLEEGNKLYPHFYPGMQDCVAWVQSNAFADSQCRSP